MPLQREAVVRDALRLLDEVGLDGLTVRRLAEALGVQNPALYWHFKNKQELLNLMAETMLADAFAMVGPPAAGEAWSDWLAGLARTFRRALLSHRDGARVMIAADLSHSPMQADLDQALGVLHGVGFPVHEALVGILALFDYTLGATIEEQTDPAYPSTGEDINVSQALRHEIDVERLPLLARALEENARRATGSGRSEMFESGVRLLLAGMQVLRGTAP
jgi:TetR/AcrR family tetracycline transcriptional repressor